MNCYQKWDWWCQDCHIFVIALGNSFSVIENRQTTILQGIVFKTLITFLFICLFAYLFMENGVREWLPISGFKKLKINGFLLCTYATLTQSFACVCFLIILLARKPIIRMSSWQRERHLVFVQLGEVSCSVDTRMCRDLHAAQDTLYHCWSKNKGAFIGAAFNKYIFLFMQDIFYEES